jgi:hypothetical protein
MLAAASLMASRSPVLVDAQAEQAGLPASGADRPLADASADTVPATAPVREPLDADQFAQPSIEALVRPLADFIALDLAREKSEASGVAGLPDDRLAADRSSDGGPVLTALAHLANDIPPQQFARRRGFLDLWLKAQTGLPMKRGEELARENTSLVAYAPGFRDGVSPDATGGR